MHGFRRRIASFPWFAGLRWSFVGYVAGTLLAAGAARAEAVWVREDWQQLTGEYDCGGVRLSGGQAQRLALARTLCHKKPVMILDDPFSALDKQTEAQVFAHLKELARDSIVLLISHRLYLFPQMDQVIFLDHG